MRLCHKGKKNCGAYSRKTQEKNLDLRDVLQPIIYYFPPPCILMFISVSCRGGRNETNTSMKNNSRTLRRFAECLTVQVVERMNVPRTRTNGENPNHRCTVMAARVSELLVAENLN